MVTGLEPTSALKGSALAVGSAVLQGRFRVLELLGRGGMGDVYLAEQLSLGRKVALKTLHEDLSAQPGMTERFRREALLLSSVDHPSVVRVIDFGEALGAYVLVMEYVEGESLGAALREGPFTVERARRVLREVAEGLDAIHSRGIVHRDLKLDNVLLATGGGAERARLLDFGIARLAEGEGPTGQLTQAGMVLGTPEYLAPEQATGARLDARTDVYAFGVLAYKLLAGRGPFDGPTPREFVLQHLGAQPPPVEHLAPHLAAQAPELGQLVMRCLRKNPDERPASGAELHRALSDTAGGPAVAPAVRARDTAPGCALPPSKSPHRRRVLIAAGGAVLLAALVAVVRGGHRAPADETPAKVAALLDEGRHAAALELIDRHPAGGQAPLRLLRAEALHQQQRHDDEWHQVAQTPRAQLGAMRLQLLSFLLDDYATHQDSQAIAAVLMMLPDQHEGIAKAWAERELSAAQWGALRWADARRFHDVDLVKGYLSALGSTDCEVLARAAQRLGELADPRAIDGLRRVVAAPRPKGFFIFGGSCGHHEASEALRRLKAPEAVDPPP